MKQILNFINNSLRVLLGAFTSMAPLYAFASSQQDLFAVSQDKGAKGVMVAVTFIIIALVLSKLWIGILQHGEVHEENLKEIEQRPKEPYLPSLRVIVTTVACTAGLFLLSIKTMGGFAPFSGENGTSYAAAFFAAMTVVSIVAQFVWAKARHFVFAVSIGTLITFILVGFYYMLFDPSQPQNPFFMALGIVSIVAAWKFLFGPWRPQVKATVLGTFILWLTVHMFMLEEPSERSARLLSIIVAFIPACIWCMLFLKEHRQRISLVILMFFAGMLSTAPILFYDALVRNKVELNFFLFTIKPESFSRSSSIFVSGNLVGVSGIHSTILTTLISFLIVGFIEEISKFWVLKSSGKKFFSSIDDVLQLGIIVAIGFAFAENIINPSYFLAFVRGYILNPETPQWGPFFGNILGRSILTNMVHILSSGVLAYFYGKKLFAVSVIEEDHKAGKKHPVPLLISKLFRISEEVVFRNMHMTIGIVASVLLHGLFNFLVTLPDILPGNPRTIGDIFGAAPDSILHYIALLIIPSLFYVVGGFWILSVLFYKKECMKERGVIVRQDTFVQQLAMDL